METTFQQFPLWSQVEFVADKAPARDFRVSLEDIESGTGHLIAGELANYDADGIPFEQGDILFGKLRPYLAKCYHAPQPGTAGGDIHVYRPLPHAHPRFIYYVVSSGSFVGHASVSTTGVKMPRTDWAALRRFPVPLPPRDTQRAIADYLDRETSEIDAMLDKLDGLGRLLEERRQSEVRDSVAPEGATFTQVKYLAQVSLGKTVQSKKLGENDRLTNYVRAANIQPNGLALDDQKIYMTPDELVKYDIVANDVLVVEGGAGYGRSVTVEADMPGWGFQNHVIRLRPNHEVVGKFLDYTIKNHLWGGLLNILSDGATIPAISSDKARELPVLAVSYVEQERIVQHLDETTARIDAMLAKTQQLKDLLTERRSALITAAVTGQIEVH
ncbi:restriction endonuclease subunit S [Corynebacterium diphtheriae]